MGRTSLYRGPLVLALVLGLAPVAVFGQYSQAGLPAESPYWWTLSDQVTPAELRHAIRDRSANLERLAHDIAQGRHPQVPAGKLAALELHVDGRLHPELVPMWDAFDVFALRFEVRDDWETSARAVLAEYGLSAEGVETVIRLGIRHRGRELEVIDEIGPHQRELVEIVREAERRIGEERARQALRNRELQVIASASGRSPDHVRTVLEAAQGDPSEIAGIESVIRLREELSGEDWQALRSYLLHDPARFVSMTVFEAGR